MRQHCEIGTTPFPSEADTYMTTPTPALENQ